MDASTTINISFLKSGLQFSGSPSQNSMPEEYHSSAQRLAAFHEKTAAATDGAVHAGFHPVSFATATPPRNTVVNVGFITSGRQFSTTAEAYSRPAEYRSSAQRLAEFHNRTLAATMQAASEGKIPSTPLKAE